MSEDIRYQIPHSTIHWISEAPKNIPIVVLLRHSVRDDLPPNDVGYGLPITANGKQLSHELGAIFGNRLRSLHTSPLVRCIQTAESIQTGAISTLPINSDRLLGDPGVFVIDGKLAFTNWKELGHEGVMDHLVKRDTSLPGIANADSAARFLVQHMLASSLNRPGFHVFVTHDSLVTATAARMLGVPYGIEDWPLFLEAAFFWQEENSVFSAYRDVCRSHHTFPLCHFDDVDVIEFARREIAQALGSDCAARFFLAGGAFKSLLTGMPPRDLDVWAASNQDRDILLTTLVQRGAIQLSSTTFSERFQIGNRILEIPFHTESRTLSSLLDGFDIGLSAIGVEFEFGREYRVLIHPMAKISVLRKEILLIKPLPNWKYALTTLERMHRYQMELRFRIPNEEVDAIWNVFDSQDSTMKQGMVDRYKRTSVLDCCLIEEVEARRS
ncbi:MULTISPECIES: histidine phosphatase family protein [unclassified Undibacterium]|uniref:histidine phosphatase family protein n=1 Tax=unclassified Undibacterium TaxID=2630295 RepID=UPI002AC9EAF1|nr:MULTISPECIES: histidine phosphatase family protein [unclassified Undibacterium]MEB0141234.1 histidine phosphatase family protein [Undibacterium sp. CCC2.1]MEB0174295.1 histidine phosphatase family protein [Undibacterium sp. CCC1.1]MEB0178239.1 histidine phosphatase family protein [Undibacterium sp. CCC3.4]MEB0217439.1 histidine phosphatase family protein [Undibacterium sp. 5I2]WPX42722.1 histidine phosphatase family protein [Undibacterium sp. CCC3.4]